MQLHIHMTMYRIYKSCMRLMAWFLLVCSISVSGASVLEKVGTLHELKICTNFVFPRSPFSEVYLRVLLPRTSLDLPFLALNGKGFSSSNPPDIVRKLYGTMLLVFFA